MSRVVEVRGLAKSYGGLRAVDDVSFDVESGEAVCLLGPNASGKTTTLRCVAGLLRPDSGSVRICGIDLRRGDRRAKQRFSFLPQEPSFPSNVTVREVLDFHARLRGLDRGRVESALREAGMTESEASRMVGELSGGMRQRLSLAVAGIAEVPLMVFDEPTANLDPESALRFRDQANRWRAEGRSLLFSTHVLTDVEQFADKVLVLVDGKPVAQEDVSQLQADLRQVALLRVDVGRPTEAHLAAAMESGATDARLNHGSVIVTAPVERRYAILKRFGEMGSIYHFDTEEPSIEHIYLKYVREASK